MANKTILEELDAKISLILEKYSELQEENKQLKETEGILRKEISKLEEDDELKELELEEISLRIEKSIGLYVQKEETSLAS